MTNGQFRFQDFYDPQQPCAQPQAGEAPIQPATEPSEPQQPCEPAQPQSPGFGWSAPPLIAPGAWTGAQRVGWLLIGFLGGVFGVLVASMANVAHPYRSEATKMALTGLAIAVALSLLAVFLTVPLIAVSTSQLGL